MAVLQTDNELMENENNDEVVALNEGLDIYEDEVKEGENKPSENEPNQPSDNENKSTEIENKSNENKVTKKRIKVNKNKKIGPQKQKDVIRTLLKRSKIYEIRNITRRIEKLRQLKGSEIQQEKNLRKVNNLLKEMEALKDIIVEHLTEKLVDVFKGTCSDFCNELWEATVTKQTVENKLQELSTLPADDELKYQKVAYIKLFSSKDVVQKLRDIQNGKNMLKPHKKPKKGSKKKERPTNKEITISDTAQNKQDKPSTPVSEGSKTVVEDSQANSQTQSTKTNPSKPSVKKVSKKDVKNKDEDNVKTNVEPVENTQVKRVEEKPPRVYDSFFLGKLSSVDNDETDERFETPVTKEVTSQVIVKPKRNRMGQRTRQKLMQNKQNSENKSFKASGMKRKPSSNDNFKKKFTNDNFKKKSVAKPVEDVKSLHPSWQAKKKQNISAVQFTGTKITFDD